jgi:hypothetical protein
VKVGDLVIRTLKGEEEWQMEAAVSQREELGTGIVLSKQIGGYAPAHECVTVYYAKAGKSWDIAESLMEVVSESR